MVALTVSVFIYVDVRVGGVHSLLLAIVKKLVNIVGSFY